MYTDGSISSALDVTRQRLYTNGSISSTLGVTRSYLYTNGSIPSAHGCYQAMCILFHQHMVVTKQCLYTNGCHQAMLYTHKEAIHIEGNDLMSFDISHNADAIDWVFEIGIPTCSYRMGVPEMGYGAAVIGRFSWLYFTSASVWQSRCWVGDISSHIISILDIQ